MGTKCSTPAASTTSCIINLVTDNVIFQKAVFSIQCDFRTCVPFAGYISLENLNRHHFLVCNDVLQHQHPLRRPKTAKIESRPQADTQATFADGVNVAAFFLTNSCTLSGRCPVNVSTSSDIRSYRPARCRSAIVARWFTR